MEREKIIKMESIVLNDDVLNIIFDYSCCGKIIGLVNKKNRQKWLEQGISVKNKYIKYINPCNRKYISELYFRTNENIDFSEIQLKILHIKYTWTKADPDANRLKTVLDGIIKKYDILEIIIHVVEMRDSLIFNTGYVYDAAGSCTIYNASEKLIQFFNHYINSNLYEKITVISVLDDITINSKNIDKNIYIRYE